MRLSRALGRLLGQWNGRCPSGSIADDVVPVHPATRRVVPNRTPFGLAGSDKHNAPASRSKLPHDILLRGGSTAHIQHIVGPHIHDHEFRWTHPSCCDQTRIGLFGDWNWNRDGRFRRLLGNWLGYHPRGLRSLLPFNSDLRDRLLLDRNRRGHALWRRRLRHCHLLDRDLNRSWDYDRRGPSAAVPFLPMDPTAILAQAKALQFRTEPDVPAVAKLVAADPPAPLVGGRSKVGSKAARLPSHIPVRHVLHGYLVAEWSVNLDRGPGNDPPDLLPGEWYRRRRCHRHRAGTDRNCY